MEVHIVLSYDLGLKGDYSSLYSWLDEHKAIECGNNLAALAYESDTSDFNEVYEVLKKDLENHIKIDKTDRLYMIMQDSADDKMKGRFLFGNRKRAPWEGYHMQEQDKADIF
ncbi:hypothetical protein [Salegentibacter mishustinae]|uniref:hypothetical protein n=1 Tax=Salegentibacter mishustinae TaxID=270918 RepID=UPI002490ABF2|nr:hypothetical protein [Salegentibacter mishustinae]